MSRLVTNSLWFAAGLGLLLIAIGVLFTLVFGGATRRPRMGGDTVALARP